MKTICLILVVLAALDAAVADTNPTVDAVPVKQGDVKLRTNLWKALMTDYERGINPDAPNVTFGLSLMTLSVNEEDSTLDTNVWLHYSWYDSRLAWDTSVFPIDVIRVDSPSLWHPDVRLFNSGDSYDMSTSCVDTNALIYPNGRVLWIPPCKFNSLCKTTLKTHPYEAQVCTLKFGSWTYDSDTLDFSFDKNETTVDLNYFQGLSGWKVISTSGVKNNKIYPCCPETYTDLTYSLTIQRKPESACGAQ